MKYVAGFILVLLCSGISFAQTVAVKAQTAELRDSKDPYMSRIVLMLPRYYPLSVYSETPGYYEVSDYKGRTGWISKEDTYVPEIRIIGSDGKESVKKMHTVVVKSSNINVRSGPGTDREIYLRANSGVAFKVIGQEGEWLKVLHESGNKGWVHANLVWGAELS